MRQPAVKAILRNCSKKCYVHIKSGCGEFIESLGTWVEESIFKRLQKAAMADECTDVANAEELSVFCRWEEGGIPVECFLEIILLKKANAETIYSTLIECLKKKNLQVGRIVGLGFDGAATLSGRRTSVQAHIKKHSSCSVCTLPLSFTAAGLCAICQ